MPLSPEILMNIKNQIEEADKSIKSIADVIVDLRASGIDASAQDTQLQNIKAELRKLQLFYSKQAGK